jgi:hypothetical protein
MEVQGPFFQQGFSFLCLRDRFLYLDKGMLSSLLIIETKILVLEITFRKLLSERNESKV